MLNILFDRSSIVKVNCNKCLLLATGNKKCSYIYMVQCLPIQVFSLSHPEICPKSLSTLGMYGQIVLQTALSIFNIFFFTCY